MALHRLFSLVVVVSLYLGVVGTCSDQVTLTFEQSYNFTSPGSPWPYKGGVQCRWKFSAPENSIIKLQCPEFDVLDGIAGCLDLFYISGRNTPICGDLVLNEQIPASYLDVYFSSIALDGFPRESKGFQCTVKALKKKKTEGNVVTNCGTKYLTSRIVGGSETELHEWPWQVGFRYITDGGQFCGGSLISPNWVLTASHCMEGKTKDDMYVVLGEHDILSESETNQTVKHYVSKIIMHSGYFQGYQNLINDISVVQLSSPVEDSQSVSLVCLPTNFRNVTFVDEVAIVTGWGHTTEGGSPSKDLYEVSLPVITNSDCTHLYGRKIYEDQMCAYEEGKDSCQGDSGGPMVWKDENNRYQQIGIVSWGDGCARKYKPGIYARVTSYIDWIEENTNTRFSYTHEGNDPSETTTESC